MLTPRSANKKSIMKAIRKIIVLLTLLQASGCHENEMSEKGKDVKLLTETPWSHSVVTHATDGDLSDQYESFAIAFTKNPADGFEGTFVISNGGYAFPENSGKWKFNDDLDRIIFDSGRELSYQLVEGILSLDFTVSAPGGRVSGLSGHFVFELKPL